MCVSAHQHMTQEKQLGTRAQSRPQEVQGSVDLGYEDSLAGPPVCGRWIPPCPVLPHGTSRWCHHRSSP